MASSRGYLDYILEQLSDADGITFRAMMGEFIIYCKGKVIGGIYDDRFLLKQTDAAKQLMKTVSYEIPYKNGKEMLLVDDVDDDDYVRQLVNATYDNL